MSDVAIIPSKRAIQYTGSNSAAIDAAISDFSITSESSGTLNFNSGGNSWSVSTNGWVVFYQGAATQTLTNSEFTNEWAVAESPLTSAGWSAVPTIALPGSTTVAVNITPAMPDTSYTPQAVLNAGAPGTLSITGVSVVDVDTVNVTVSTSVTYLGGAHVVVHATT